MINPRVCRLPSRVFSRRQLEVRDSLPRLLQLFWRPQHQKELLAYTRQMDDIGCQFSWVSVVKKTKAMYPLGGIILAPLVAGYIASVACRIHLRKGKKPSIWCALICAVIGTLMSLLATFQWDLLTLARWETSSKAPLQILVLMAGIPAAIAAFLPGIWIVWWYRRVYEKNGRKDVLP